VRHLIVSLPSQDVEGGTDAAELFTYSGQGVSFTTIGNTTAIMQVPINKTQYRVYSDKTFKLGSTSALDGTCTRMVKNFQKFGGKKIMFESLASGVLAQSTRFAEIIIGVCANNDATAASSLEFTRFTKTFFTDP